MKGEEKREVNQANPEKEATRWAVVLTDQQRRNYLRQFSSDSNGITEAIRNAVACPPPEAHWTEDPGSDREVFASLSIVPDVDLKGEEADLNRKRLQFSVAMCEADEAFKNPQALLNGQKIREFLADAKSRRESRVRDGAIVGMGVTGTIDSILIADFLEGKRSDLLKIHLIE